MNRPTKKCQMNLLQEPKFGSRTVWLPYFGSNDRESAEVGSKTIRFRFISAGLVRKFEVSRPYERDSKQTSDFQTELEPNYNI